MQSVRISQGRASGPTRSAGGSGITGNWTGQQQLLQRSAPPYDRLEAWGSGLVGNPRDSPPALGTGTFLSGVVPLLLGDATKSDTIGEGTGQASPGRSATECLPRVRSSRHQLDCSRCKRSTSPTALTSRLDRDAPFHPNHHSPRERNRYFSWLSGHR